MGPAGDVGSPLQEDTAPGVKKEAIEVLESLMLKTPFPDKINGIALTDMSDLLGVKPSERADISQQQLADFWVGLSAPTWVGNRVALTGYVGALTLLIRLSKSFLEERVSGAIYATLLFDWTRYCSRFAAECGFKLSIDYDHLVDLADRYPELERSKGTEGMLSDSDLHSLGQRVLESLSSFWLDTKKKLTGV